MQIPPMFSAIKVDGKRAYQLARKGIEKELKARQIVISSLEFNTDLFPILQFKVVCTKGTYIRTLANDIGIALGSGAYLESLRRTRIGNFKISDAMTPEILQENYKKFVGQRLY